MTIYRLPPVRIDSMAMDARTLSQQIDWGLREHVMPDLWKRSAGAGVLVIILDSGVPQHRDLPKSLFEYNLTDDASPFDSNAHQTHCAGIVAALNNSDGVVGWAPDATLAHIKVLDHRGSGLTPWIAQGIRKATEEWQARKQDFVGCVISMSLGGGYDAQMEDAIRRAGEAGIIVVAAAGNSGYKNGRGSTVDYPGSSKYTLAVAAYRRDGQVANFSSGGEEVDIAMPGEEILSTVPGNKYQVMSGTSMATPAAAGLIACVLSSRPHDASLRTLEGLRNILKQNAQDRGDLGKDHRFGFGVPHADALIRDREYWFF